MGRLRSCALSCSRSSVWLGNPSIYPPIVNGKRPRLSCQSGEVFGLQSIEVVRFRATFNELQLSRRITFSVAMRITKSHTPQTEAKSRATLGQDKDVGRHPVRSRSSQPSPIASLTSLIGRGVFCYNPFPTEGSVITFAKSFAFGFFVGAALGPFGRRL